MKYLLWIILALIWLMMPGRSEAQDREFGIRLSGLNEMGLIFKKDKGTHWTRWHASFGRIDASFGGTLIAGLGLGLNVGKEKRRELGDKVHFLHGPQFLMSMNIRGSLDNFNGAFSIGYGQLLGVMVGLKNDFFLSVETIPSMQLALAGNNDVVNLNFQAGFNSEFAALVATKRF